MPDIEDEKVTCKDSEVEESLENNEDEEATEPEKEKKDKKDAQIEELTDKYKRLLAEFDNYRKRTEKERSSMYEMGAKDTIEKILPVVDNFERGLATVKEENVEDPFVVGMNKIFTQLGSVLDGLGVKPIVTEGETFDPNLHNAVMHIDDENFGDNVIVEEFQKGYMFKENVLRHSMVKVAN